MKITDLLKKNGIETLGDLKGKNSNDLKIKRVQELGEIVCIIGI